MLFVTYRLCDRASFSLNPVNRAGSVSEISPRYSFLRKNVDVFNMRSRIGPVTEIADFVTDISVTGIKNLFSNHSAVKREQIIFILNIIRRRQGSGKRHLV